MLVKKTIVLYGKGGQGHLTAVRVGGSTGLKLVLDARVTKLALAFKAGNSPQLDFAVTSAKTEIPLKINLESQDELSAAIYSEDGSELLSGGKKTKLVFPKEVFSEASSGSGAVSAAADISGAVSESGSSEGSAEEAAAQNRIAESAADESASDESAADESAADESAADESAADESAADESATETVSDGDRFASEDDTATDAAAEPVYADGENAADVPIDAEYSKTVTENSKTETQNTKDKDSGGADLRSAFSGFAFNKGENFYVNIRGKLEEIMTINPECKELERLIPDSKWVKVYYDEDEYYVVGILTEEGAVRYLGYGVPGVEGIRPPKEAEELCDFLPSGGEEEGYWIMLQKADNGELIK